MHYVLKEKFCTEVFEETQNMDIDIYIVFGRC